MTPMLGKASSSDSSKEVFGASALQLETAKRRDNRWYLVGLRAASEDRLGSDNENPGRLVKRPFAPS